MPYILMTWRRKEQWQQTQGFDLVFPEYFSFSNRLIIKTVSLCFASCLFIYLIRYDLNCSQQWSILPRLPLLVPLGWYPNIPPSQGTHFKIGYFPWAAVSCQGASTSSDHQVTWLFVVVRLKLNSTAWLLSSKIMFRGKEFPTRATPKIKIKSPLYHLFSALYAFWPTCISFAFSWYGILHRRQFSENCCSKHVNVFRFTTLHVEQNDCIYVEKNSFQYDN